MSCFILPHLVGAGRIEAIVHLFALRSGDIGAVSMFVPEWLASTL